MGTEPARSQKQGVKRQRTPEDRSEGLLNKKGAETRMQILRAAEKLFADTGYEATTFAAIADELGIHQPGIFYYFPDKQSLYRAMLDHVLAHATDAALEVIQDETQSPEMRLFRTIDVWIDCVSRRPTIARLLLQEAGTRTAIEGRARPERILGDQYSEAISQALSEYAGAPVDALDVLHYQATNMGSTICFFSQSAVSRTKLSTSEIFDDRAIARHKEFARESIKAMLGVIRKRARAQRKRAGGNADG